VLIEQLGGECVGLTDLPPTDQGYGQHEACGKRSPGDRAKRIDVCGSFWFLRTKLCCEACECIGGSGKSLRGAGCGGFKLRGGKNAQRAWMAIDKMLLDRDMVVDYVRAYSLPPALNQGAKHRFLW
jgi:hypothetical protein